MALWAASSSFHPVQPVGSHCDDPLLAATGTRMPFLWRTRLAVVAIPHRDLPASSGRPHPKADPGLHSATKSVM